MTTALLWLLVAVLVLALAVAALAGVVALRVRRLDRRIGSFECVLREAGRDWRGGIAIYGVGQLRWYRLVSLSLRPDRVFTREQLELLARGEVTGEGELVEVRCRCGGSEEELSLAMRPESLAGLVSWLEAAPPRGQPLW